MSDLPVKWLGSGSCASIWLVATTGATSYQIGQTALIAEVPEAEPIVGSWRDQFDIAAAAGVPAHVTVLFPFLGHSAIDPDTVARLQQIVARHRAFPVQFLECRRFPSVLYLAPQPETQFRALTSAVAERWPEAQPYGGQFDDIVPHLTVAHGQELRVLDKVEAYVSALLPVSAYISTIQLLTFTGERWREEYRFKLGR
jgi:2'-5' RNA ligase